MKNTFRFLKDLNENNNREWFNENKSDYEVSQEELKIFTSEVLGLLKTHDQIDEAKSRIYRIYRDVRFSNNKTPFKTNRSAAFARATEALRGGYYFSIAPDASFAAAGFFGSKPTGFKTHSQSDLWRTRKASINLF